MCVRERKKLAALKAFLIGRCQIIVYTPSIDQGDNNCDTQEQSFIKPNWR